MTAPEEQDGFERRGGGVSVESDWLTRGGAVAGAVCVIRSGDSPIGTGFLIGPDLVLTCHHVVEQELAGNAIARLRFVFDFGRGIDGTVLTPDDYKATKLVARSENKELDFALFKLERLPRRIPIRLSPDPWPFHASPGLCILQHPNGERQRFVFDLDAYGTVVDNGARVLYSIETDAGSSGSPVFGGHEWTPVALHQGFRGDRNKGIPLALIAAHRDVKAELERPPEPPVGPLPEPPPKPPPRPFPVLIVVLAILALGGVGIAIWAFRHGDPGTIAVRLTFYRDDTGAPQALHGLVRVYTGIAAHVQTFDGTSTVVVDDIPTNLIGKPLRFDLESPGYEVGSGSPPLITKEEPLRIAVRRARINATCTDAVFDLKVLGVEAADVGPDPSKKDVGVRARFSSTTHHPIHVTGFEAQILGSSGVPMFPAVAAPGDVEVPPNASTESIVDVELGKDQYALFEAGHPIQIRAKCQNPDQPSDAGEVIESLPYDAAMALEQLDPFVSVGNLQVQSHQVTRGEYASVMRMSPNNHDLIPVDGSNPEEDSSSRSDEPISFVTNVQAEALCKAINARLPTVPEWRTASGVRCRLDLEAKPAPLERPIRRWGMDPTGGSNFGKLREWTSTVQGTSSTLRAVCGASAPTDELRAKQLEVQNSRSAVAGYVDLGFRCVR